MSQAAEVPCIALDSLPSEGLPAVSESVCRSLDAAFGLDGLGLLCVTGDQDFQAKVRQMRDELLPLATRLGRLSEEAKEIQSANVGR